MASVWGSVTGMVRVPVEISAALLTGREASATEINRGDTLPWQLLNTVQQRSRQLLERMGTVPAGHSLSRLPIDRAQVELRNAIQGMERLRPPSHFRPTKLHLPGEAPLHITPGISRTVDFPGREVPRVLFLSLFPADSNGSGTYTQAVARYMARSGGEVRILAAGHRFLDAPVPDVGEYVLPFKPHTGKPLEGAAEAFLPVLDSNPASPFGIRFRNMSPAGLKAYTEGFADAVHLAAKHMRPDILVVNHAWVGAIAAQRTGLPYVCVGHGTCSANMAVAKNPAVRTPQNLPGLVIPAVRMADRVIAITDEIGSDIADLYGFPPKKIVTIHNGYNDDIFYPQPDLDRTRVLQSLGIPARNVTHVVSYAGRLVDWKGVKTLIEAAAVLSPRWRGVHFVIAGDGVEKERLKHMAASLGLGERFHFLGHRSLHEISRIHAVADLGVVPSWGEAFGIVPLEIAGTGTPVIASDVGGLRITVTENVGIRVPPRDHAALAAAMDRSLRENLKQALGEKAAATVQATYRWDAKGEELLRLLKKVVQESRRDKAKRVNRTTTAGARTGVPA